MEEGRRKRGEEKGIKEKEKGTEEKRERGRESEEAGGVQYREKESDYVVDL